MAIYYDPRDMGAGAPLPEKTIHGGMAKQGSPKLPGQIDQKSVGSDGQGPRVQITSRAELIESIKRGESPTWVPNPAIKSLIAQFNSPGLEETERSDTGIEPRSSNEVRTGESKLSRQPSPADQNDLEPEEIERPRSALHTGDFFDKSTANPLQEPELVDQARFSSGSHLLFSTCPTTPWYEPRMSSSLHHAILPGEQEGQIPVGRGSRAQSLGRRLSSSFVFRAPTSPLVHTATNAEPDSSELDRNSRGSSSPEKSNRRRTLPPDSFNSFRQASSSMAGPTNYSRPFPVKRESSLPYQAHQPRRSLNLTPMQHSLSNPQTPIGSRSRRPSSASDHSPIQHASMVGSFEESILRGRMSTAPSKPLDFVAQIGVLGRGDCKPSLRCPAHVTVPFPAVFYNYPSIGIRSFSDESPSPYVGTIDLEHTLKPIEVQRTRKRVSTPAPSVDAMMRDATAPENTHIGLAIDRNKRDKQKRSTSARALLGGCYRVPEQGQLQIVIKNPNKTAVKLFLIPYSLDGMEPGTKTFVRQRSFSAGPILEKAITENPQASLLDPLRNKSILRYLIHLKFCCPSAGRFYVYDNIRVVFANRVPDGKENLRNEVQLPEPRYSSYRPGRETPMGSLGAKLTAEKAARRRSSGFGLTPSSFDAMDGLVFTGPVTEMGKESSFQLSRRPKPSVVKSPTADVDGSLWTRQWTDKNSLKSNLDMSPREESFSGTGFVSASYPRVSQNLWPSSDSDGIPLTHEPFSRTISPTLSDQGEGLLSRELRILEEQKLKEAGSQ